MFIRNILIELYNQAKECFYLNPNKSKLLELVYWKE
jgi:hypothetical protein